MTDLPPGIKMNKFKSCAIAAAIGLAFTTCAVAQGMSKDEYKAHQDRIVADYKSAKAGCGSLAGNAKDICMAGAKGKEKVAKADLEARYKPTEKTHFQARVARAEADFSVAKEKCDDLGGNGKDVCLKEAKAAETAAKANAKAQMKTASANAIADEKSADARMKASNKSAEARKDAAAVKRDADYAVAHEKCDAFAGAAKERCIAEAKARYGKS